MIGTDVGAGRRRRRWLRRVLVVGILALALRAWRLDEFPAGNTTADEYAWTWAGLSTVTDGTPTSWSWLRGYSDVTRLEWRGHRYRLVRPWLDHPPGYPVFMGLWMRAAGTTDPLAVDLGVMRLSSVLLALVQLALFATLARRLLPGQPHACLLAVFFLAVAAPAVVHHRLVVAEALMTPLGLAAYLSMIAERRPLTRAVLAVLAGALVLVKVAALAFVAFLVVVAWRRREPRDVTALVAGAVAGLAAYAAWGLALDGAVFRSVLDGHGARFSGFHSFQRLLTSSRAEVDVPFLPFLVGTAFAVVPAFRSGGTADWRLAIPVYVLGLGLVANQHEIYPWYRLPLYPFMALGLGWAVTEAWRRRRPVGIGLWLAACGVELAIAVEGAGLLRTGPLRAALAVVLLACLAIAAQRRIPLALANVTVAVTLTLQVLATLLRVALWSAYSG